MGMFLLSLAAGVSLAMAFPAVPGTEARMGPPERSKHTITSTVATVTVRAPAATVWRALLSESEWMPAAHRQTVAGQRGTVGEIVLHTTIGKDGQAARRYDEIISVVPEHEIVWAIINAARGSTSGFIRQSLVQQQDGVLVTFNLLLTEDVDTVLASGGQAGATQREADLKTVLLGHLAKLKAAAETHAAAPAAPGQ